MDAIVSRGKGQRAIGVSFAVLHSVNKKTDGVASQRTLSERKGWQGSGEPRHPLLPTLADRHLLATLLLRGALLMPAMHHCPDVAAACDQTLPMR